MLRRPDREIDWHMVDDETMGAFLDGRVTSGLMVGVVANRCPEPWTSPPMLEFGRRIWVDMPKIVYSRIFERGTGTPSCET